MKNFDPAFVEKIQQIESRKPENMQLQVLADIALMMQDLLTSADSAKKDTQKHVQDFGALLIDFRDQLTSLNKKEAPETPDYAKPIVEALDKLSVQVKGIDVKPTFTPKIDVKSPEVSVMAPKVDLSELNQTLKKSIPKAFEEAIKLIPQTEIPEQDDSEMLTLLRSLISTTEEVRDKRTPLPAFPKQMVVTNSDGSAIGGSTTTYYKVLVDKATTDIIYIGKAPIGTATSTAGWQIKKIDKTVTDNITITFAASGAFTAMWNNRGSEVYS